jgi:hypothetical protein
LKPLSLRRRLVLLGGHQVAIRADEIVFLAHDDLLIVLLANIFRPEGLAFAMVFVLHRPGAGQGVIDHRDIVMKDIRVGLVEINLLLDDGLIVRMERRAAAVEGARALEAAVSTASTS